MTAEMNVTTLGYAFSYEITIAFIRISNVVTTFPF